MEERYAGTTLPLYLLIISDWLMLSLMLRLVAESPAFADYNYLFFAGPRLI